MTSEVRLIRPSDRTRETIQTAGMRREQAIARGRLWAGQVTTAPGMVSGWHHHGDYETAIYVVTGALRMESGPGGRSVVSAEAGDFLHVPLRAVHRESNPGDDESVAVVFRAGGGVPTVNVDGPEA